MNKRNDLELIQRLIAADEHVPPSAEILKSELRSDSGLEPPVKPPPKVTNYVIIKWKFHIPQNRLDAFHHTLTEVEDKIEADVKDLKVGAAYSGTYAELPYCIVHQTFWTYESLNAIDAFKSKLAAQKKSKDGIRANLAKLIQHIEDPTLTMHRLVRASALDGLVAKERKSDPILDLFAS